VLRAAGTNCDIETVETFQRAGAEAEALHVNRLTEAPERLAAYNILCIPGGFSYGDDIGSGVVFAQQLRSALRPSIEKFLDNGGLALGICNGFQVLIKAGMLTASSGHFEEVPSATLTWNASARYEDRWIRMIATPGGTPWLPDADYFECPVRHAEGRFVARDEATFRRLEDAGQLVLRYADADWKQTEVYPANPNGSQASVAGLCSRSGQVLGLMPHPECHTEYWHHPQWTRKSERPSEGDGMRLFRAGVTAARGGVRV
jgi:phosphoribosylformylglycinamidine synthase